MTKEEWLIACRNRLASEHGMIEEAAASLANRAWSENLDAIGDEQAVLEESDPVEAADDIVFDTDEARNYYPDYED
jgi:hypothetical protein